MKKYYYVFKANLMKEFIESKRYFANTIVTLVVLYVIFLVMFLGMKIGWEKEVSSTNLNYLIISFLTWYTSSLVIQSLAINISKETMKGTIEQMFLSRMSIDSIVMFKMIAIILVNFISVLVLLFLVMLSTGHWINIFSLPIFILYILAVFSMFGISFALSGLAIYYKQVDGFLQIAMMIFLAISFSSTKLSSVLNILPFIKAIDLIKQISAEPNSWMNIPLTDYVIVLVNSVVYLSIGYYIFHYFVNKATDKGIIGSY